MIESFFQKLADGGGGYPRYPKEVKPDVKKYNDKKKDFDLFIMEYVAEIIL